MNKSRTSYSFLLEMIWVCGFFSITACIFVLAFTQAGRKSRTADALNHGVLMAQNAIEEAYASYDSSLTTGTEIHYFDSDWKELLKDGADSAFLLKLTTSLKDHMICVTARVEDRKGNLIYSLDSEHYPLPEGGVYDKPN